MRLARVLGAVGRGLISAGVIVLLFVAYQLWGTGFQHSAAQGSLNNEFEETTGIAEVADDDLAAAAAASQQALAAGQILEANPEAVLDDEDLASGDASDADATEGSTTSTFTQPAADPTAAELFEANFTPEERARILAKLYPEPGEAFARVVIPDISVDQISVEGVSVEDLRKGPGHYRTTPNPGQAGNSAIAGHRTTYGAPFNRVDELDPGDSIFVTTAQGTFEYRVLGFPNPAGGPDVGYFIVSPSDTWVLDQKPGQNILTLTACHPKFSARQRIIVQAELVGEPAPTIPRDEAIEPTDINLDSGSVDERASESDAVPAEEQVIIGDDVAADDDPSVDADGNPIDIDGPIEDDQVEDDQVEDGLADVPDAEEASAGDDDEDVAAAATDADSIEQQGASTAVDDVALDGQNSELATNTAAGEGPLSADDFGEGLNGDPEKVQPAILWGLAGLFIWAAAWFMGRELERKWTLYAIGLFPFLIALWSTFVNLDQALPSY